MSEKSIKNLGSKNKLAPILVQNWPRSNTKFVRNCLIMSCSSSHQNVVNLYISYILDIWSRDLNTDSKLNNCLF